MHAINVLTWELKKNVRLNSYSYSAARLKCLLSIVAVLTFLFRLQMFSRQDYRIDSLYDTAWIFNCNVNIFNWALIDWTTGDRVFITNNHSSDHRSLFFSIVYIFHLLTMKQETRKNSFLIICINNWANLRKLNV